MKQTLRKESKFSNLGFLDITLIITIVISLFLRIINIFFKSMYYNEWGLLVNMDAHPPFAFWFHELFIQLFGVNVPMLRFASLIFAFGNFFLIFYIAKKLYGENIAKYALLIGLFSFWALFLTTSFDHEASEVMFASLILFVAWLKYKETNFHSMKQMLFFSATLFFALFTKLYLGCKHNF
ncbi:ArnT family glycosyltransferase [Bacteroidota bacterium]